MPQPPAAPKAIAFFDGQKLFHSAKSAFGYTFPNYDVMALAKAVCASKGWTLEQARFYTGVPAASDNPSWNHYWTAKGAQMGREGVYVFTRPLRYRNKVIRLPGAPTRFLTGTKRELMCALRWT